MKQNIKNDRIERSFTTCMHILKSNKNKAMCDKRIEKQDDNNKRKKNSNNKRNHYIEWLESLNLSRL